MDSQAHHLNIPHYPVIDQEALPQQRVVVAQPPQLINGPGYRVYEAQSKVNSWACYIKWFSFILFGMGVVKIICALGGLISIGLRDNILIKGEGCEDLFELPKEAVATCKLMDCLVGILFCWQGKLALKASTSKTRVESWNMIKSCSWVVVGHVLLYIIQFFIGFVLICNVLQQFDEMERKPGQYEVHQGGQYQFTYEKATSTPENDELRAQRDGMAVFFIFFVYMMVFVVSLFMFCCCCSCVFGAYYKFHSTIKEYEHIAQIQMIS
jgi:hypothetical protein